MKKSNKKTILLLAVVSILLASFAIVYADSLGSVVASIIDRISIAFENIGQDKAASSEKQMVSLANETETTINSIIANAQNELSRELEEYKNIQINKKNHEIELFIKDIESSIEQKKIEKLNKYQQRIDDIIDKEYEKLINDLTLD